MIKCSRHQIGLMLRITPKLFTATFTTSSPISPAGRGAALLRQLADRNVTIASAVPKSAIEVGGISEVVLKEACGDVEEEIVEMEEMFVATAVGREWGGDFYPLSEH